MNKPFPSGHQAVMVYLVVANANGLIGFMQQVLQGSETYRQMRDANAIMHAEVNVNGCTIMIADATPEFSPRTAGLFAYVDDADAAYAKALELGAKSIMKPADQPYGRSAGITDPYGVTWWLTTPPAQH